jgi:hypothetical protein
MTDDERVAMIGRLLEDIASSWCSNQTETGDVVFTDEWSATMTLDMCKAASLAADVFSRLTASDLTAILKRPMTDAASMLCAFGPPGKKGWLRLRLPMLRLRLPIGCRRPGCAS